MLSYLDVGGTRTLYKEDVSGRIMFHNLDEILIYMQGRMCAIIWIVQEEDAL